MSDNPIYRGGHAPDRAAMHRDMLRHCAAVLSGREPPDVETPRREQSLAELFGFPIGTDHRLVWRYLKGDLGEIGTELRDKREARDRAEWTKRRKRQIERHNRERARRQPSPLQVVRCVAAHEAHEGVRRGAAAAASRDLKKSPSFISKRLAVAEDWRRALEAARAYFQFRIDFGGGDQNEQRALPALLTKTEQLLQKLPPRRRPWTDDTHRGCSRQNRTVSKSKPST